jgi:hypothetical protein
VVETSTYLISVSSRVIFRTNNQTTTLLSASIDGLDDIDQLLLVLQNPVQLVVVTSAEIAHHVFVAEEEHQGDWVVDFVHLLEVRNLVEIAHIDGGKVLDSIGDMVEDFILSHTVGIPVATEADNNQAFLLRHDSLVNVPAADEMREYDRAHGV